MVSTNKVESTGDVSWRPLCEKPDRHGVIIFRPRSLSGNVVMGPFVVEIDEDLNGPVILDMVDDWNEVPRGDYTAWAWMD